MKVLAMYVNSKMSLGSAGRTLQTFLVKVRYVAVSERKSILAFRSLIHDRVFEFLLENSMVDIGSELLRWFLGCLDMYTMPKKARAPKQNGSVDGGARTHGGRAGPPATSPPSASSFGQEAEVGESSLGRREGEPAAAEVRQRSTKTIFRTGCQQPRTFL